MESYFDLKSEFPDSSKNDFTNMRLVCDAAQELEDLELVSFTKKYGQNPWFSLTTQWYKCQLYATFIQHRELTCEMIKNCNLLMHCITVGVSPSFIKHLIKYGVNVNYKEDTEKRTPLMKACEHGNYDTVKILLDAGADPRHKTTKNGSTLELAFHHSTAEVLFLIYDAIFQGNPTESELLQHLTLMLPMVQNIIIQAKGDRVMLKLIHKLLKFLHGRCDMNARELAYTLEKLSNFDHVDDIAETFLHIGHNRNDSQMIHILLRRLYRQKKTLAIVKGQNVAVDMMCRPNILNLYQKYNRRLNVPYQ